MKFDDVLLAVGEFRLYQKRLLLLICVKGGSVVNMNLSPVFTMKVPKHRSVCLPACMPVSLSVCLSLCLNTKKFKRTIIYFDTDTQYVNFRVKINKRSFEPFCVWILF